MKHPDDHSDTGNDGLFSLLNITSGGGLWLQHDEYAPGPEDFKVPERDSPQELLALIAAEDYGTLRKKLEELVNENRELREKLSHAGLRSRQLDERVFDLFTIAQANKVLVAHHQVKVLAEIFLSVVVERVKVKKCCLFVLDEEEAIYKVAFSQGYGAGEAEKFRYRGREGFFWRLVANGEPFSVRNVDGELRFPGIFKENALSGIESAFWIPLRAKENVVGILTIDAPSLSDVDSAFLSLLSSQAAVALENAFLLKKLEDATKRLEKQMKNLSILYDVGKALNFVDSLTRLLALILDRAIAIAESQRGSLMLYDEKTDEMVIRVVRGVDPDIEEKILSGEIQCTRIKKGEGVAGRVFVTGDPLIINDARNDPRFIESRDPSMRIENILCVPLKVYEECIGVINISNKKDSSDFTEDDLGMSMALANQAAVAINNARLFELAVSDGLTGLFIKRHFMQKLEDEVRRSKRYNHKLSLVMVDIDHFKEVNDRYGHQEGDMILVAVSRIFRKSVRSIDFIGRYGGDEFCFALPETSLEGARGFCERLRKMIEATSHEYESFLVKNTVSLGIATFPDDAGDFQLLMKYADCALYKAKRAGRNRTCAFEEITAEELADMAGFDSSLGE
ncbi:MAG: diguanylate cyclase [Candidatus Eremiobacteraeota bacterium]|nr:diguanylate cyclase [Candidatus Eremiobacteraeota bacterium]